jgi:peptide/nickel transport system substrate-binding protein
LFLRIFLIVLFCIAEFACISQTPEADHLSITVPYNPDSLDPHATDTLSGIATGMLFYEGLVTVDSNLKILPALAIQWENPDDQTWILHLRPNVQFHNGKMFSSKDVVYSFDRLRKNPNLEMGLYARSIAEIQAPDPLTVVMKTDRASSVFLNKIRLIAIIPDGTSDAALDSGEFGSGPYQLKSLKKESVLHLQRFEKYWGQKPDFQQVDYYLSRGPEKALHLLEADQLQVLQCNSKILGDRLKNSRDFDVFRTDSLFVDYISLNLADDYVEGIKNPFHEKSFRQALHRSIDRTKLVSDLTYYAVPAIEPIPVFVFGYNPAIPNPGTAGNGKITEMLHQSGWNVNQKLPLYARQQFTEPAMLLEKQLAKYGIQLDVKSVSDQEFFEKRKKHEVLTYIARYACTTGDASDLFEDLLYSPDREGLYRHLDLSRYSHPTIDLPENEGRLNLIDHRRAGLQALMSIIMDDLILIPLYVEQDSYAVSKKLVWSPRYDSLILAQEVKRKVEQP